VTGATGFVGGHVAERCRELHIPTRAIVRKGSDVRLLTEWGVELIEGDLTDASAIERAVRGVTIVIHCAAKVGDWGPVEPYRDVNVRSLEKLLVAAEATGTLRRFLHISSLGVYEARDHFGTDETEEPSTSGIDGYTLTKVEAEQLVRQHIREHQLPATIMRPGFIYGPRDRTILPRLLERLQRGQVKFFGSGEQLMNNTYVGNLVDAIFLALDQPRAIGGTYNITDGQLVSKRTFIRTVAELFGYPVPTKSVPLGVAKLLTKISENLWRLLGKTEAPLLSNAKYKFLGLNLDFCIDKARRELGYAPQFTVSDGMQRTVDWFRHQKMA
jgi:nucleoside-diphosphate-sugar epimerase